MIQIAGRELDAQSRGKHTLMSFIGCIGTFMNGSRWEEIHVLPSAVRGIDSILNLKPNAAWAMCVVVSALFQQLLKMFKMILKKLGSPAQVDFG